jgi:hypothetical protein
LRHGAAAGQRLPPRIDALLLLIGDFGALALGLDFGQIRRRLSLRDFALPELGALCVIVSLPSSAPAFTKSPWSASIAITFPAI